jgi:hypothetical protein
MSSEDDAIDTIHLDTPGRDLGHFSTLEVRPRSASSQIALTSRTIAFPAGNYTAPPNLAAGFSMLDLAIPSPSAASTLPSNASTASFSSQSTAETDVQDGAMAVRANLVGSDITAEGFRIGLETWGGGIMRAASATWIEHAAGAKECHFGQIDTMDDDVPSLSLETNKAGRECVRKIKFPVAFKQKPAVVCWINRLDLAAGKGLKYRLATSCSEVTPEGAIVEVGGWGDCTKVNGAGMCWIAFPANKRSVDWGRISTDGSTQDQKEVDVQETPQRGRIRRRRGRTHFRRGWFASPPTVLAALDMLDMKGDADLRIAVRVEEVTKDGFTWRIDTWVCCRHFANTNRDANVMIRESRLCMLPVRTGLHLALIE